MNAPGLVLLVIYGKRERWSFSTSSYVTLSIQIIPIRLSMDQIEHGFGAEPARDRAPDGLIRKCSFSVSNFGRDRSSTAGRRVCHEL